MLDPPLAQVDDLIVNERPNAHYSKRDAETTAGGLDAVHAEATCIAVSHSGNVFATGGTDAKVKLWDFGTGNLITCGTGHSAEVKSLKFSPDDRQLVSVGEDGGLEPASAAAAKGDLASCGGAACPGGALLCSVRAVPR